MHNTTARGGGVIRVFALRAISRCNGQPIPETTLGDLVRMALPHIPGAAAALPDHLHALEAEGYLACVVQDLTGDILWALTDKGRLWAAQIDR